MTEFIGLRHVEAVAAVPLDERLANIRASFDRETLWLHDLPECGKPKDRPIAIVGGGPSLRSTSRQLPGFASIMIAGSAHDWIMERSGFEPRYCVISDPDPVAAAQYLRHAGELTTYLVASHCHESVFGALKNHSVTLWHCLDDAYKPFLDEHDPNWTAVGGGCTVGLRAIAIAILLGYSNIHLFGFDSCLGENDAHHAYPYAAGEELGEVLDVRIGSPESGKTYRCEPYHIAQAKNFEAFYKLHKKSFTPVFHGGGLMSDIYDRIKGFEGVEL